MINVFARVPSIAATVREVQVPLSEYTLRCTALAVSRFFTLKWGFISYGRLRMRFKYRKKVRQLNDDLKAKTVIKIPSVEIKNSPVISS